MNFNKHLMTLFLIRFYPKTWRMRYEDEFAAMLEQSDARWSDVIDLLLGIIDAHWYSTTKHIITGRSNIMLTGIVNSAMVVLALFTVGIWIVAANVVPPATPNNTVEVTGTFVSVTSSCCDDLVVSLREYETLFYFNRRAADLKLVDAQFESGDTITIIASKRFFPKDPSRGGSTPSFALESTSGAYYAPGLEGEAMTDYRVYYGVWGLISAALMIPLLYIRHLIRHKHLPVSAL